MKQVGNLDRGPVPIWVPFALAAGPVVALGFARFGYALILPAMSHALGWSLTMAGAMNAANALGYLLGALGAAPLARRAGHGRTFMVSVFGTSLALLAAGFAGNSLLLAGWRFASGAAGGVAFVVGGGLVAQSTARESVHRAALLLGIYFGGAGLGIVLSAWTVPFLLASFPQTVGWRVAWVTLGVLGLLTLTGVVPAMRHVVPGSPSVSDGSRTHLPWRRLRAVLMAYGLYGTGYIVYMTFIVVFLQRHGAHPQEIIEFWTVLGSTAMASAFLWGRLLGQASGGRGVAVLMGLVLSGVLLPLWSTTPLLVLGSAILFGSAFLAVVTSVATVARRSLPMQQWTAALGALTVVFGLGQSVGPFLAGWLSDGGGGVRFGLILSAVILGMGILTALAQPDHPRADEVDELTVSE